MLIRRFEESDLEPVIALWEACGLLRPWNDPRKDIARKLAHDPEHFLVGELDGVVVAAVMAGYDGHRGWMNYLAVSPDRRRQGLARELVAVVEQRMLALGCPKLSLQVRAGNDAALAFYEALGFGVDATVSMGKRLIPDD